MVLIIQYLAFLFELTLTTKMDLLYETSDVYELIKVIKWHNLRFLEYVTI
ncbi:MAG: hypothetical protein K0S67_1955 [Nitrososphaeraceae archaeon]|jgi:hypothetical protein|nr:hypothetical protein [Nitrososphaeraceae archaeon]MDF2769627.1 hypothetical protein [Nitrososphaeraceae archaeon]